MNPLLNGPLPGSEASPRPECSFRRLYGDTTLGRLLSRKFCDLDRDGSHYGICESVTNPVAHTWALAWGMALALSKPEWAYQVLNEFNPGWQSPESPEQWPAEIEELVRLFPSEGPL